MALDFAINIELLASFVFVFGLVYALLAHAKLFQETRGASVVIALTLAFFSTATAPIASFLIGIMPIATILLILLFFFVFVRRILIGGPGQRTTDQTPTLVVLAVSLILLGVFWNRIAPLLPMPLSPDNMLWLLGLFVVGLIFYAAYTHKP